MASTSKPNVTAADLLEGFSRIFLHEDLELLFELISPDCKWIIVPSGEYFTGPREIRTLVEKTAQARTTSGEVHPLLVKAFADAQHICLEFLNRGIVKHGFANSSSGPESGRIFEIDFCVTAYVRDGKIAHVREYFDTAQFAAPPGQRAKFFV